MARQGRVTTTVLPGAIPTTVERALESGGTSNSSALYALVCELVASQARQATIADIGCGTGTLHSHLINCCARYVGVDVVRHEGFPTGPGVEFVRLDLDDETGSLPAELADVVCCLETIEHVENPRALARTLARVLKPGGLMVISTPNQLSVLSKLCLLTRNEFVHFQERPGLYPAHLSALLECDLRRIAREMAWTDIAIHYTAEGRIPGTDRHWPAWLQARHGWRGRAFSDNVVLSARKPIDR